MTLAVFLFDTHVGDLTPRRTRLEFRYRDSVIDDDAIPALSVRLPKREAAYDDAEARPFFANLLPEAEYRRLVAWSAGVSESNTSGLLGAIGGECAGAVSVSPEGGRPSSPRYEDLGADEMRALFSGELGDAFVMRLREARLSIAGVQAKLAFRHDGDRWRLPLDGAPSTHILKRGRTEFAELVENEVLCMRLAKDAGLPAAGAEQVDFGRPVFSTPRYDRVRGTDEIILRLHQEDFCQALGVEPERKYQSEGGPGVADCARVIREYSALPLADIDLLIRWMVFNWIVGNEDAHAKNLAFLYADRAPRLAPFYDIVSTAVYRGLKRKAAMKIGGEYRQRFVGPDNWAGLARDVGVDAKVVRRLARETAERARSALGGASSPADTEGPIVASIRRLAEERVERLLRSFTP
ncbi:MAG: type II toxin-antitoxin system HipA family toxin [Gemmatimonadaceae bacterium]